MESLDELSKTSSGKPGFFKHVFNFDEESKAEMLNLVQYIVLALVPVIILNKLMQRYVPEADDEKGSLEITAEVLAQVLFMFFGILLINRIITYVPTYSGEKYPTWNVISAVLPMLVILISLQTKLGEKISILFERLMELWEGPKDTKKGKKGNGNVKVSQPISQNQMAMSQSLNSMGSTSISALPPAQPTQTQQLPNYDQMYQQDSTPLVGAATPGMESFEPMAANAMSGGFGNAFSW
jgi:hypothetical protein